MKHQSISVAGTDFVLVPAGEYDKLSSRTVAGIQLPPLPPDDADGTRPAVAYARASIARDILAQMNILGLTAAQLARDTGIYPAVLNYILKATRSPSEGTVRHDRQSDGQAGAGGIYPAEKACQVERGHRCRRKGHVFPGRRGA